MTIIFCGLIPAPTLVFLSEPVSKNAPLIKLFTPSTANGIEPGLNLESTIRLVNDPVGPVMPFSAMIISPAVIVPVVVIKSDDKLVVEVPIVAK